MSAILVADYFALRLIQHHLPHLFEVLPEAIFLKHHVKVRSPQGRLGHKSTWNRLTFHSLAPKQV